ncbi:hypothetical protein BD410DRAFT_836373 [Rickenella mellea]|uniref:RlpA-like protein double-psi beta-barrel domain-containing protein n=1 Tax=Rickenella mellea TaxID=50990 RepID=A0A4Y7QI06_9AGAM|nr:hypothetical protein BD410DRAFT_836373 [Rickenella mellea]
MQLTRVPLFATTILASFVCAIAVPVVITAQNGTIDNREADVTHAGQATWFNVGLGACGQVDVDSSHIVAISSLRWANGGNCEQWIQITANGQSHFGQTRDECPSCGIDDLDLSPALFGEFEPLSVGVFEMTWHFMPKGFTP